MAFDIVFHEKERVFHLYNEKISYLMRVMENEQLEHLYYGKRIHDREGFSSLHEEAQRSQMSVCIPEPGALSMQYATQEYPSYGTAAGYPTSAIGAMKSRRESQATCPYLCPMWRRKMKL